MSARPRKVGQRLFLIGAVLALASASPGTEPARIGNIKFLRDGKVDKICFDYAGTLRYQESQFPSAQYGYVDFEPAVYKKSRTQMKPAGTTVREVVVRAGEPTRQRVRILYKLNSWIAPTFHDTGSRMEIRFSPTAGLWQPAVPPADGSMPNPAQSPPGALASGDKPARSTAKAASLTEGLDDPIFLDYLKLSTSTGGTPPAAPSPQSPRALRARQKPAAPAPPENQASLAAALGGEGAPPAAESSSGKKAGPLAGLDILSGKKAFLPETGIPTDRDKVSAGRGYEFVDLNAKIFQKEVSVNFKEAELQNAIRLLARSADINIVMDPTEVKGTLTVELNNVPVGAALSAILRARQLEIVREAGGIYRVVPENRVRRTARVEQVTVHFPLNWVSADAVKTILDPVIDGDIAADTLGNSVIITDTPIKVDEIANIIRRIDVPEKQVMLEARLVEMNTRLSRGLGIQWDLSRADRNGMDLGDYLNVPGLNGTITNSFDQRPVNVTVPTIDPLTGAVTGFDTLNLTQGFDSLQVTEPLQGAPSIAWSMGKQVGIFGQSFNLSMLLEAAERAQLAKVLVAPRVVTLNNQPARISVIRRIPYRTSIVGAGGAQSITFNYEDVGIDLEITPNITNNDYVRMKITPQQTILIGQEGEARPTIDQRRSETNVIVKDEETAVIAGLREQDFSQDMSGAPWFNKIPVLGWAFKSKNYRNLKTDLMAFVTPHIIKEGQMLTDQEQFRYNEIDIQWDLPDYFFDDVKIDLNK